MDLKAEYRQLKSELLAAVDDALNSMQLFLGPNVQALEEEFAEFCGVEHAIGVASGTDALILVLDEIDQPSPKERISISYTIRQISSVGLMCTSSAMPAWNNASNHD